MEDARRRGLTEEEVRTRGIPYEVGIARFRETSRGHIMGLNSGMMKMNIWRACVTPRVQIDFV